MDFVDFGTMTHAPLNSANSYMKNHLTVDIRRGAEVPQHVVFFTRSLMFNRRAFSTKRPTFLPFNNNKEIKEDNKKG